MTTPSDDPWKRVGAYLVERRTELGYRKRASWARAVERPGFRSRVITDLELGERDNYSDSTLETAEEIYQLAPGSIRRAVATGTTPQPEESEGDTGEEAPSPYTGTVFRIVKNLEVRAEDAGLSEEEEREMIERAMVEAEKQAELIVDAELRGRLWRRSGDE